MAELTADRTAPASVGVAGVQGRLQSIDILRGAIMIIMALDHLRDFFSAEAQHFAPDDLSRTTAALFFTRWITHFCAPTFMLLAGAGAFLWQQRGRSTGDLSRFLVTRGLWLILLELTVVRCLGLFFTFDYSVVVLIVFWALGASMIALAALIHLPARVLLVVSVGMMLLHNLLDGIKPQQFGNFAWVWNFLHRPGGFKFEGHLTVVTYPLIPWVGVMAAGYCFGKIFLFDSDRRRALLLRLGGAITVAFVMVRAINLYGDPRPWAVQKSALFTMMSFLNCSKYPPSLDFLLMTLGPAILVLGLIEHVRLSRANPLLVFGRVPLFYFVLHIPLIHVLAVVAAGIRYGDALFLVRHNVPSLVGPSPDFPADYGYRLLVCYVIWILIVAALYWPCRWFADLKARRRDPWLSYL
jgi:uncharacterized membrane protein